MWGFITHNSSTNGTPSRSTRRSWTTSDATPPGQLTLPTHRLPAYLPHPKHTFPLLHAHAPTHTSNGVAWHGRTNCVRVSELTSRRHNLIYHYCHLRSVPPALLLRPPRISPESTCPSQASPRNVNLQSLGLLYCNSCTQCCTSSRESAGPAHQASGNKYK